jgi:hypothetical protein
MSSSTSLASLAATTAAGFFLAAAVLLTSDPGFAQTKRPALGAVELPPAAPNSNQAGTCSCPSGAPVPNTGPSTAPSNEQNEPLNREKLWPKPSLADLKASLDDTDAIAALEAVQLALTEVGDGATYVWHRKHGRLSGAVQPTTSFKDGTGHVCRHIVVALTSGTYTRKAEGIACRQKTGVWVLEG